MRRALIELFLYRYVGQDGKSKPVREVTTSIPESELSIERVKDVATDFLTNNLDSPSIKKTDVNEWVATDMHGETYVLYVGVYTFTSDYFTEY